MRRIDEDETRDVGAVSPREDPNDEPAKRMADQDERRLNTRAMEERPQLVRDAASGSRQGARIAPAESCAVVAAHARESRDLRLDERPAHRGGAERGFEHDRGRSGPRVVHVQLAAFDVNQSSGRTKRSHTTTLPDDVPAVHATLSAHAQCTEGLGLFQAGLNGETPCRGAKNMSPDDRAIETGYDAWLLLLEQMKQADAAQASNLGQSLAPAIAGRFEELTQKRYESVRLTAQLGTKGVVVGGAVRSTERMSVGTREQLSTLYRLSLAEYLQTTVVLDDQLVQSDDTRMDWFRALLVEKARSFQIVVFTCRPWRLSGSRSHGGQGHVHVERHRRWIHSLCRPWARDTWDFGDGVTAEGNGATQTIGNISAVWELDGSTITGRNPARSCIP